MNGRTIWYHQRRLMRWRNERINITAPKVVDRHALITFVATSDTHFRFTTVLLCLRVIITPPGMLPLLHSPPSLFGRNSSVNLGRMHVCACRRTISLSSRLQANRSTQLIHRTSEVTSQYCINCHNPLVDSTLRQCHFVTFTSSVNFNQHYSLKYW